MDFKTPQHSTLERESLVQTPSTKSLKIATALSSSYEDKEPSQQRRSDRDAPGKGTDAVPVHVHGAWGIVADCFCILAPLCFVIFGILVIRTKDVKAFSTRNTYSQTIQVLATLFPIVFAYVLGRMMVEVSRWKLEKGVRLRSLEQLIGSRSVGAALVTAMQFPLTILTPFLLVIWIFSPLGSQAILRMHDTRVQQFNTSATFEYFDTTQKAFNGRLNNDPSDEIFRAALLSPDAIKREPLDLYGNIKVPFLSSYGSNNVSDWQGVPSQGVQYSSLLGIPITNLSTRFDSSFEIWSTYIELECETVEADYNATAQPGHTLSRVSFNETKLRSYGPSIRAANGTWQGFNRDGSSNRTSASDMGYATWNLAADTFVDERSRYSTLNDRWWNDTDIEVNPGRLLFQASFILHVPLPGGFNTMLFEYFRAMFRLSQKYVESRVECKGGAQRGCRVVAQRISPKPHLPEALTHLSFPETFGQISYAIAKEYKRSDATVNRQDPTVAYVAGLPLNDIISPDGIKVRDQLAKVQKETLATHLGSVLNTYIQMDQVGRTMVAGNFSSDWQALKTPDGGFTSYSEEVYVVHAMWMSFYMLSSLVLLAGGVASVVLCHLCYGPEVLGYASTIIRDSRFIDMPAHSRGLDSLEITDQAGNARLRYGYTLVEEADAKTGEMRPLLGVGLEDEVATIRKRR